MLRIGVTGASGHIGGCLIRSLLEDPREKRIVALAHEDTRAFDGLDVEVAKGDILDVVSLHNAFKQCDIIYHLAARITLASGRDDAAHRINTEGVRNIVNTCRDWGIRRLVHFSSIHAFSDQPRDGVVDETRAPSDLERSFPYDRSKAAGQQFVLDAVEKGLSAVIIHPTAVVGPYDYKPSAMGSVLLDLYHQRMPALVSGGFNWVDVRDVCAGAIAAEQRANSGERYLLAGHWHSVPELAAMASNVTGKPAPRLVTPMWLAHLSVPFASLASKLTGKPPKFTKASLHALVNHQKVSHEKAARELGYRPRPLNETLRDTYGWFDENGFLN